MATNVLPLQFDGPTPVLDAGRTQASLARQHGAVFASNIGHISMQLAPIRHQLSGAPPPPPPKPALQLELPGVGLLWIRDVSANHVLLDDHTEFEELSSHNMYWVSADSAWARYSPAFHGYHSPSVLYHTMFNFVPIGQVAAISSSPVQRAMFPLMMKEKQRLKLILSQCVTEDRYPTIDYMDDPHDNKSLQRKIFQLVLNLGEDIPYDGKKAILNNVDVQVDAQTVELCVSMEGGEVATSLTSFTDMINPSPGSEFDVPFEHKTFDKEAAKMMHELKEEELEEGEPKAKSDKLAEDFEKVDLAEGEVAAGRHIVP